MNEQLRILHLEDNDNDSELVAYALKQSGVSPNILVARDRDSFLNAIETMKFDVVLSDNNVPSFEGARALRILREKSPHTPFIFVSGFGTREEAEAKKAHTGATDCVRKTDLRFLAAAISKALSERPPAAAPDARESYRRGMENLLGVVQELSLARDITAIMAIVRHAARELTGADGATFVLRDGDLCHYADEEAIAPLWKGRRFPMSICISGWTMLNRQPAVIEDIYADSRIPVDAYRPTFVKSLVMVPIRSLDPVGAIGTYWAVRRQPLAHEVKLLQALADSTSIALENVQLYAKLEAKVEERTARLQALNDELEAFSYSVSHDLRAPLRHIDAYVQLLRDSSGTALNQTGQRQLAIIADAARRMGLLIEDLLSFSRTGRVELQPRRVNMNELVEEVLRELEPDTKGRKIVWDIGDLPVMSGDRALLKQAWINLLSNAVKYTRKRAVAEIRVGAVEGDVETTFFVADNGAGFDMQYADRLFGVFQRLHRAEDFEGTGIGLANVRRMIGRHGGRTWAKAEVDRGATFFFTLPQKEGVTAAKD